MKWTLRRKLFVLYALIGIVAFVLLSTLGSALLRQRLLTTATQALYSQASAIADEQKEHYFDSEEAIQQFYLELNHLASLEGAQIWILDESGNCFINTAKSPVGYSPVHISGFDPIALGKDLYTIGTFFNSFPEDMITVMVPVTRSYEISGYVAIHMPLSRILEQRERILGIVDLMFLIIYLLSLTFLVFFHQTLIVPLHRIIQGTREYAQGNLNHKIIVKSHDEVGALADTLNYMADELNKTEEYQRKFIANVSHDFRSPLTSIKGYAEAIQDGTIPYELQGKYLGIIINETERLNKLTQNMLTLNDLDSNARQNLLDLSVFDLNAVIKNTVASFEGTCTRKRIKISLILTGKTLQVRADVGKIQQVLYNLIDNAIKFSDHDKVITIETTVKNEKVLVSVKDMGCGISRESLPHVFERFYKEDSSRGRDRKGSGLGLSIVKEALTAHGENINVISTVGVGTEFLFTLPRANL